MTKIIKCDVKSQDLIVKKDKVYLFPKKKAKDVNP